MNEQKKIREIIDRNIQIEDTKNRQRSIMKILQMGGSNMAVKINGINHFAISVANLEETIKWYSDIFGFTVVNRSEIPGAGIRVAHLQGTGFLLEVFEASGSAALPEDRKVPNRDLMTQGNKHMSFGVPDGRKAKAELEALGVEVAMVAEVDDTYGVFIRDNTGNLIEIFEEKGDVVFNQHK